MSALEREIIEKFQQLQPAAKQRVRLIIDQQADQEVKHAQATTFDFATWLEGVDALRQQIRDSQDGKLPAMDIIEILCDIRDGEDE
jgi:hypothetical protein